MAAALAAVFVFAGCGTSAGEGAAPPAKHFTGNMTTVHVDLNWLSNVEFSGIWVAMQKGWFAQNGLKIKGICGTHASFNAGCVRPFDYTNTPESMNDNCVRTTGSLCIGFDDSSAVAIARQAGQLLKAVWVGSQKTPFGFMTCYVPPSGKPQKHCKSNSGRNITSVKQWKGLKIGYQADELYVPEIMLGNHGMSLSQVTPVKVTFDPTLLQDGTVDAYLVFVNNEPIQLHLEHVKTNVIPAYKNGMGAFYADAMFMPDSQMGRYNKQIATFVRLVDKGWKWAMHHPTATAKLVIKHYFTSAAAGGGPKGLKQQELEIAQFASTLSRNGAGKVDGRMTLGRWKTIIKDLSTYPGSMGGQPILRKGAVKAKDCFTNKFAPAASK